MNKERISIIGLGKLGACTAACLAARGYEVIGVDVNSHVVNLINEGKAPVVEPGLQDMVTAAGQMLTATVDPAVAIRQSDVTFLLVPTPSDADGSFSDRYMREALEALAAALGESDKPYHLFVITSTVSPGTTDEAIIPLIEQVSGRKLNVGFGVCYNPEFIALGSVIRDFLNPDLVLIGESNRTAGDQLEEIYGRICDNQPHISRMSIISAEITKISLNAYVTMKISFANTLSNLCERIQGAQIDAITSALGADRRISPYYLKGGPAFGGPCFPRDNRAFMAFARRYGYEAKLAEATEAVNELQAQWLTALVRSHLASKGVSSMSILGLSYKPNTPVIEESAAVKLIARLLEDGVDITVYDPLAMGQARELFGDTIAYAASVEECVSRSSVWIVTTPLEEFQALDDRLVAHNPTTIIDCWRVIDPARFSKGVDYVALGGYGAWSS
jgi:UDPglucose 6-dehydrogenase